MLMGRVSGSSAAAMLLLAVAAHAQETDVPWHRWTIDDSSRGADGVRLADANGDGLLDVATGWEEGGVVRVYLNPGPERVRERWPAVTVGEVGSVEDAVLVDLDSDGAVDVVSSCEGDVMCMYVHWAPTGPAHYLDPAAWVTEELPASKGLTRWMFCVPVSLDGRHGIDLLAGSKEPGGCVGWFESPENPRDLAAWKWHPLYDAGWIMTIDACDMDGDKDPDVLVTDRKGEGRGCLWLQNPGAEPEWPLHRVAATGREVMFADTVDLDDDGLLDTVTSVKPNIVLFVRRAAPDGLLWETYEIPMPESAGRAKAVTAGDIDLDGKQDLVFTCEGAAEGKSGVVWLSYDDSPAQGPWEAHDISGPEGQKFDLARLLDLDGDGDLDVITCEERANLGVVWYENPTR